MTLAALFGLVNGDIRLTEQYVRVHIRALGIGADPETGGDLNRLVIKLGRADIS